MAELANGISQGFVPRSVVIECKEIESQSIVEIFVVWYRKNALPNTFLSVDAVTPSCPAA